MSALFDPDHPEVARVWQALLDQAKGTAQAPLEASGTVEQAMIDLYTPLLQPAFAIAQMGQSLDGHIATKSGASHYVTGPESLVHLHRLRALVDAVVVGWPTVEADNPQLTVRNVVGPNPQRVVIDARGHLSGTEGVFTDAHPLALRLSAPDTRPLDGVETIAITPDADGRLGPSDILAALRARGLSRVLIEGGGQVVSSFVAAGALDRLHVVIAPLIIGSGRVGLGLPGVETLADALRPPARQVAMGADVLFDLDLGAES